MFSEDDSPATLASVAHFNQWVGWREEMVAERRTKVPYNPRSGGRAASDNPRTWARHDEAQRWVGTQRDAGTGVMLGPVNDDNNVGVLCGIDLDSCRDKATGKIERWAQEIIDRFASYSEISPSGTGAHVLFRLAAADTTAVETLFDGKFGRTFKRTGAGGHPPAIEIYRGLRYFAVTWEAISSEDQLRRIDVTDLEWLMREAGPKFAAPRKPTDDEPKDESRSGKAFRAGAALKAGGATYEQMRDALLAHQDPDIAVWAQTKGMADGEREIRRIYDKAWQPGSTIRIDGGERRLVKLDELNERFALLQARGMASVYVSRYDCMTIQENDLRRRLANEVVLIRTKDDKPVYEEAFKFWNRHARRHIYQHIAFTSKELPEDTLNLFSGFGVTPRKGRCDRILNHIDEVICSKDAIANNAILNLMAWQIQHIGKPSRIIVILKTLSQQAGKGLLLNEALLKIYGDAGFIPSSVDQVLGRFNDTIVGRAYVFLDEVMFFGDRRAADTIKSLATTDRYGIETKGLPVIQCPVGLNFWMATNHEVAAFIEERDVRYWVLNVSEHRIGDVDYFNAVLEELENGGRDAFAHHLLSRDVSAFVPLRDVPKNNDAKREMIKRTINPYDARKWIEECCETRQMIGYRVGGLWETWLAGLELPFHVLANAYTEWQKSVKSPVRPDPTPIGRLGEVLTNAGIEATRDNRTRKRVLPDPDPCLEKLFKLPMPKDEILP